MVESILGDDVRAKARDLAASMAGEDGVGVAVDAIERAIGTTA